MKKNKIAIGLICALALTSVPFTTFAQGNNNDKGAVKQEIKQTVQTQAQEKKPEVKEQAQSRIVAMSVCEPRSWTRVLSS